MKKIVMFFRIHSIVFLGDKSTSERSISIRSGYFRKAVSYTGPFT